MQLALANERTGQMEYLHTRLLLEIRSCLKGLSPEERQREHLLATFHAVDLDDPDKTVVDDFDEFTDEDTGHLSEGVPPR